MPFNSIPLEVHGYVFRSLLNKNDQASFRGVSPGTLHAFTIAVVNEQFIDLAASRDDTDSLTNYDVRWFPVHPTQLPSIFDPDRVNAGAAFRTLVCLACGGPTLVNALVNHVFLLNRKREYGDSRAVNCTVTLANARVERVSFVGFQDVPTTFPPSFLSGSRVKHHLAIPDSTTNMGEYSLFGMPDLTSVALPSGVTCLSRGLLQACYSLTSVVIPDTVTDMGLASLSGCSRLTAITLSRSITSLPPYFMQGCVSLVSISLPDDIASVGVEGLSRCAALTTVTLPAALTSIPEGFLSRCPGLSTLTIPPSVRSIHPGAMQLCPGLTKLAVSDTQHIEGLGEWRIAARK